MKVLVLIIGILFLLGCYTHIQRVERKWGPPAKIESHNNKMSYYWYFYKGQVRGKFFKTTDVSVGWLVVEIITDPTGKILQKRKYWKQPAKE